MLGTSKLGLSRNGSWVYQASGWYHSEWLTILQISVFNWWYPPHFWLEGRFVSILAGYILLFAGFFAQHVGWSSPLCSYPPHESGMCWVTAVHHEIVASFPTWIPALVADIPLLTWNPQLYITYVFFLLHTGWSHIYGDTQPFTPLASRVDTPRSQPKLCFIMATS